MSFFKTVFVVTALLAFRLNAGQKIHFCQYGVDCGAPSATAPSIKTIKIKTRGQNEGIRVDSETVEFTQGTQTLVRLVNESNWTVYFEGNLTPGWLKPRNELPGPDTHMASVGVPGKLILDNRAGDRLWIKLVYGSNSVPLPSDAAASLKGTYKTNQGLIYDSVLKFVPEVGKACKAIEHLNLFHSILPCASSEACFLQVKAQLALLEKGSSSTFLDYTFFPDTCQSFGDRYSSTFRWDAKNGKAAIRSSYQDSLGTTRVNLTLDAGQAGEFTGEACGLFGNWGDCGKLQLSQFETEAPFVDERVDSNPSCYNHCIQKRDACYLKCGTKPSLQQVMCIVDCDHYHDGCWANCR